MAKQATLLLFGMFMKARIIVTLTWTTETLSITCCQCKNQLLMWNFEKDVNERILELQWFFNETTLICLDSESIGFHVETLYYGRIERNGTGGILITNVTSNDVGKYTLYVKIADEKIRNVQHLSLTVFEQVPQKCKPIIEIHHQNGIYCSTTCLEGSQLSPEWIINDTRYTMGLGRYLPNHAGIYEQAFCCLRGLKCHDDDQFKFCMINPIPSIASIYKKGIYYESNETSNQTLLVLIILNVILTGVFHIPVIVKCFVWTRHKLSSYEDLSVSFPYVAEDEIKLN